MSEKPSRKTRARGAERERRLKQGGQKSRPIWQFALGLLGVLVLLFLGYAIFVKLLASGDVTLPGGNGAHFQADTEKIDLGDRTFGQTVGATFTVQYTSDSTLTLTVPPTAAALEGC